MTSLCNKKTVARKKRHLFFLATIIMLPSISILASPSNTNKPTEPTFFNLVGESAAEKLAYDFVEHLSGKRPEPTKPVGFKAKAAQRVATVGVNMAKKFGKKTAQQTMRSAIYENEGPAPFPVQVMQRTAEISSTTLTGDKLSPRDPEKVSWLADKTAKRIHKALEKKLEEEEKTPNSQEAPIKTRTLKEELHEYQKNVKAQEQKDQFETIRAQLKKTTDAIQVKQRERRSNIVQPATTPSASENNPFKLRLPLNPTQRKSLKNY